MYKSSKKIIYILLKICIILEWYKKSPIITKNLFE